MSHNSKLPIGSLTPGPWHMSPSTAKVAAGIHTADGTCIGTADRDADARLWAAAPDLLVACRVIYRVARDCSLPGPVHLSLIERDLLREAITKARGAAP